jgi:hypothetical protein
MHHTAHSMSRARRSSPHRILLIPSHVARRHAFGECYTLSENGFNDGGALLLWRYIEGLEDAEGWPNGNEPTFWEDYWACDVKLGKYGLEDCAVNLECSHGQDKIYAQINNQASFGAVHSRAPGVKHDLCQPALHPLDLPVHG